MFIICLDINSYYSYLVDRLDWHHRPRLSNSLSFISLTNTVTLSLSHSNSLSLSLFLCMSSISLPAFLSFHLFLAALVTPHTQLSSLLDLAPCPTLPYRHLPSLTVKYLTLPYDTLPSLIYPNLTLLYIFSSSFPILSYFLPYLTLHHTNYSNYLASNLYLCLPYISDRGGPGPPGGFRRDDRDRDMHPQGPGQVHGGQGMRNRGYSSGELGIIRQCPTSSLLFPLEWTLPVTSLNFS